MVMGGFNKNFFANINIDVEGLSKLQNMQERMESAAQATQRLDAIMSKALERGKRQFQPFQAGGEAGVQELRNRAAQSDQLAQSIREREQRRQRINSHLQFSKEKMTELNAVGNRQFEIMQARQQQSEGLINSIRERNSANKEGTEQFGQMFGIGMNLMFMGMALQQVFGGLARSMLKTTGASAAFGAAAKSTLLPFFMAITPTLNKIAFFFMGLPKHVKMAIGAFVALLAVLGTVLFFGAQLGLLLISGLSLGMVATAAGVAAGALAILAAGFKLGMAIGNKFSREIRFAMDLAATMVKRFVREGINLLQSIYGVFENLAFFVLNVLTGDFGAAANNIIGIWRNLAKVVMALLEGLFITDFLALLGSVAKSVLKGAVDIGKSIIDGIVQGIMGAGELIMNALTSIIPGWAVDLLKAGVFGPAGLASEAASQIISVNDFILTSGGKVLQPAANDTIVGFNGNGPIQPGAGGSGEVTVNINDPVMKEDVDVERVVDEVEERVNRDTRGRTGLGT